MPPSKQLKLADATNRFSEAEQIVQAIVSALQHSAMVQQIAVVLKKLQRWGNLSNQFDFSCAYNSLQPETSAFRKQIQADYDVPCVTKYEKLFSELQVSCGESKNMLKFLQANLIAPKRFGMFDYRTDLQQKELPHRIKHWAYQKDISEMQYQQSGIYPLIADAFDALQSERICYNA